MLDSMGMYPDDGGGEGLLMVIEGNCREQANGAANT